MCKCSCKNLQYTRIETLKMINDTGGSGIILREFICYSTYSYICSWTKFRFSIVSMQAYCIGKADTINIIRNDLNRGESKKEGRRRRMEVICQNERRNTREWMQDRMWIVDCGVWRVQVSDVDDISEESHFSIIFRRCGWQTPAWNSSRIFRCNGSIFY